MRCATDGIRTERDFAALCETLATERQAKKPLPVLLNGLSGGALTAFCAECARELGAPFLFLVPEESGARRLSDALRAAGLRAFCYPRRNFVFHEMTASHDLARERLFVLHALLTGEADAIVATPAAALQFTMPPARLAELSRTLHVGDTVEIGKLCAHLTTLGYAREEQVEGGGQYARRGGILDVFPTGDACPVRLEFFGDEIDGMYEFDVLTQRRGERRTSVTVLPSREVLPDAAARARIRHEIELCLKKAPPEGAEVLRTELAVLDGGGELLSADKYLAAVYPDGAHLFSYLSVGGVRPVVALLGTNEVKESLSAALRFAAEETLPLLEGGVLIPAMNRYFGDESAFAAALSSAAVLHANAFAGGVGSLKCAGLFGFRARAGVSYADRFPLLTEDCRHLVEGGYRVLLLTASAAEESALAERLRGEGFSVSAVAPDEPFLSAAPRAGVLYLSHVAPGVSVSGYELPTSRIAVLSTLPEETAVRRPRVSRTRRHRAAGERLLSYADLREGDYVVHAVHGIGRFGGMTTMTVDGAVRDYITILYAGSDKLFLPADRLESITKYIGAAADGGNVRLSRLGGSEWQKTKSRAKAAAKDMARELIALYAARARRPGFAFPPDDAMQSEFEGTFPYEETEGQIAATEEIKRDMEKPTPMDRLLCGDVGYGKTEVALRAAFKAVCGGKQVALLVPTTILALQHYETALSRMRGFPVTVEMLSRFRTPKEEAAILRRLRRGEIDILIGTHKLLSSGVTFRNLGLLIVDEEQRFGVAQKEKLKELAGNVDVLTLTATPIPRTLNMAMNGIRDMSLLDEAPVDRVPVETYVMEHDDLMIAEAIRRELRRGGQVIYLYNRVESMDSAAARLRRALPDARIVTAHGKMEREDLSDIWQALVRGEIDVILCTTIVETGVDLPNANTLIIEDADRLGLSQLHQLRGRVGRSGRQAYAYFTYRRGKALTEIAEKRLSAIREYAAFGAGFRIALRDLEIRGAGNLLGAEQHGHIEAVGYELYVRLLNEAVLEEQGKVAPPPFEAQIDIRADAHIPTEYIPTAAGRMEMYKKISAMEEEADRRDIAGELADRYGKPPRQVERLLAVALTRALAARHRIPRVEQRGDTLRFTLSHLELPVWSVLFAEKKNLKFEKNPPCVVLRLEGNDDPAAAAAALLLRYDEVAREDADTTEEGNGTAAPGQKTAATK